MVVKHQELVQLYIEEKKLVQPYPNNLHATVKQLKRFTWKCRSPVCNNTIDLNGCRNKIRLFCCDNCRQKYYHYRSRLEDLKLKYEPKECRFCHTPTVLGVRGYKTYCSNACRMKFNKQKLRSSPQIQTEINRIKNEYYPSISNTVVTI